MKIYLIAVFFVAAFVVVSCSDEEVVGNDPPAAGEEQLQRDLDDENPPAAGALVSDEELQDAEEQEVDSFPQELKDEVEEVKRFFRRVPQLSRRSCLILKKFGYCKNKGIARFCVRYCKPRCRDLISRKSCWLVKYRFKGCRRYIGRYCRHTCGGCVKPTRHPKPTPTQPPTTEAATTQLPTTRQPPSTKAATTQLPTTRSVRWKEYTPAWCGSVQNRKLLKYGISREECKDLCLKTEGCKAIEWWTKWKVPCYECKDYSQMKNYTNSKDLAYPPFVAVRLY